MRQYKTSHTIKYDACEILKVNVITGLECYTVTITNTTLAPNSCMQIAFAVINVPYPSAKYQVVQTKKSDLGTIVLPNVHANSRRRQGRRRRYTPPTNMSSIPDIYHGIIRRRSAGAPHRSDRRRRLDMIDLRRLLQPAGQNCNAHFASFRSPSYTAHVRPFLFKASSTYSLRLDGVPQVFQ